MRKRLLIMGMCTMLLIVVLATGCTQNGVKTKEYTIIDLEKLDTTDELNIVNWTVQGIAGPSPKLNSIDWELKDDQGVVVWFGKAVK